DGAPRRQRRRQDDDAGDPLGPVAANLRLRAHLWRGCAAASLPCAAADQFFDPLCRPAAPPDRAPEPDDLCPALWGAAPRGPHRRPRQPAGADRPLRPHQPRRGVLAHRPRPPRAGGGAIMARSHRAIRHMGETHFSPARIWAMLLRYLYILRSSWPRTLELLYWPTLQMLIWGFMSQFLYQHSSYVARAFGVLLAAVMLWDLLFRSQLGLSISFLEEMWARNL